MSIYHVQGTVLATDQGYQDEQDTVYCVPGGARGYWVPLFLAMLLLQSVLTCGHPWPNQECPCQGQAEAHDENDSRAQVLENATVEILEKD